MTCKKELKKMMNSIEVSNFTKRFGQFTAVDNISFTVEEGSVFALLGPNGAGKTTTISTLCTIQEKTEGELKICGHNVTTQKDLVRNDIGIVFQDSTLDGKLTIEENLKLHCDFYNVPKKEVKGRLDFVLELVDLIDWRKSSVNSLSGGMKRRAEIARGLIHFPKVLFLDEPTTGLDPQTRLNVWDYILKLQKQKNITVFLTTHYMEEAEICSQVAVIDKSKIVVHDSPYNLKKKYTSSILKIKSDDPERLNSFLEKYSFRFKKEDEFIHIYTNNLKNITDIITSFKDSIEDIEINKGTLNDVFLTITGKEIRI
jgi:ABC-2 type transport system ATP-binding protein